MSYNISQIIIFLINIYCVNIHDIVFLGTASGYPSPYRGASGAVLRDLETGKQWLFDCGEGTQIQAQKSSYVHLGKVSTIFISHLHGDHMFGLPGLLCTIDQKGEAGDIHLDKKNSKDLEADVNIYGPQGIRRFVRLALALSRARMRYTYAAHELILREEHCPVGWKDWASLEIDPERDPPLECELPGRDIHVDSDGFWCNILNNNDKEIMVHAMSLKHTIPSVGWLIIKPQRLPSICIEKVRSIGIPNGPLLGELKRGNTITVNDKIIYPEDVLKPPLRGHRIAIMGDTYDSNELERLMNLLLEKKQISSIVLDVLVHECTLENNMFEDALQKGHSVPNVVTKLADCLNVQLLILTHFSHRYAAICNHDDNTIDNSNTKSHEKVEYKRKNDRKPTLQIILDEAKSGKFKGDVVLADDLTLIQIPPVPRIESLN